MVAFCPKFQFSKKPKVKVLLAKICKQKYKANPEKIKNASIFLMNISLERSFRRMITVPNRSRMIL
jgi:hypothetical protein